MFKILRIKTICPALFLCFFVTTVTAMDLPDHTQMVAENVYSYGDPNVGYFSMFVVTDNGVVVFETVNSTHAQGLISAIQEITDEPIRYALHSHNHWDHAAGGKVFQEIGAKTIAHYEAYQWMKANPHPDMALPSKYWKGNFKKMRVGGKLIELHYLGMNHGLGMTVFLLPDERIAYIADLVTPNRVLFTIVPDFNIGPFVESLKKIESMEFDNAVYSHSNASPFEPKDWVTLTHEYVTDVQNAIMAEFGNGTPFTEIPHVIDLPKYAGLAMYHDWLHLNVWRIMLDMSMGPFPWRPEPKSEQKGNSHKKHHSHDKSNWLMKNKHSYMH